MDITPVIAVEGLVIDQTEGCAGPRFICCICNRPIEDAELALFTWDMAGKKAIIVHKSCNCADGDRADCTSEVGTMLMYLLWNTGMKSDRVVKNWKAIAEAMSH